MPGGPADTRPVAGAADAETLERRFAEIFGRPARFAVHAPGRVNLIGEHVDYCGLPVLPIAIDRRIAVLAAPRPDQQVRLVSLDGYPDREFTLGPDPEPWAPGDWGNYAKAAARALVRRAGPLDGFDAVVTSDLPPAAGLSSSAALVVAIALTLLRTNRLGVPRLELAETLADGERFVGTQGGGMDQAVCLLARHGNACRIEFDPLRATPIPVPPGWGFVVADSREPAEKAGSARETYNRRVAEVGRARYAVAEALGLPDAGMPELVARHPVSELLATARQVVDATTFRRFRHVVTETERVIAAERALAREDLFGFGRLLQEAHASLRDDYEVSTSGLDRLTALAIAGGATGARLTGAGLGGCIVAACDVGRVPAILGTLEERFYAALPEPGPPERRLFSVEPSGPATIMEL